MTQEEKQLLLADLCARLPYGVFVNIEGFDYDFNGKLAQVYFGNINRCSVQVGSNISYSLEETKPWLRPMSSMTEDEKKEVEEITRDSFHVTDEGGIVSNDWRDGSVFTSHYDAMIIIDWLNAHHFDYRGLIEKGLALEAPKDMYN